MRLAILGFLSGIFWLQQQAVLPPFGWWPVPLGVLVWLLQAWLVRQPHAAVVRAAGYIVVGLACVPLGGAWAAWRADVRMAQELPREWEARDVELSGVVASLPRITDQGARFDFDVEKILTEDALIPDRLSLAWYTEGARKGEEMKPPPTLVPGQRWHLTVRLRRPHGTMNPHGFDFEAWALERNIRATGYVRAKGVNAKQDGMAGGFLYLVDRARMTIRDQMMDTLKDQPYRGVLVALAIGEQGAIPADQWKTFWRTGTGHL
ncbi:MAG: ComEC/Rec2 family competence protein, partial [Betaproteobacteria bacterium]